MNQTDLLSDAVELLDEMVGRYSDLRLLPVDLDAILTQEDFGLPIVEYESSRHGGLRWISGRLTPVVYRTRSYGAWSPRERFTIAHEIGHAIIERNLKFRPSRRSEYWRLEAICDAFAARLLIPDGVVTTRAEAIVDVVGLIDNAVDLASKSAVSIPVSSRRLVERLPGSAAWGCSIQPKARQGYRGRSRILFGWGSGLEP